MLQILNCIWDEYEMNFERYISEQTCFGGALVKMMKDEF